MSNKLTAIQLLACKIITLKNQLELYLPQIDLYLQEKL